MGLTAGVAVFSGAGLGALLATARNTHGSPVARTTASRALFRALRRLISRKIP